MFFNKNQKLKVKDIGVPIAFNSVIGPMTVIDGNTSVNGGMKIDGTINGNVTVNDGDIFIGKTGKIIGNVIAKNIYILGTLQGNVINAELVHINSTGDVVGNIETGKVTIVEGAMFNGKCNIKTTQNV